MNPTRLLPTIILLGSILTHAAPGKPNVIFILADDLGYGDVATLNSKSKIPTPHMDSIAAEGMTFMDAHSGSAVCTPTRYGVITGRYCWRTRLKSGVLNGYSSHLIDTERVTVADVLKKAGYHTACIGKWHLGMDLPKKTGGKAVDYAARIENGPNVLGFDYFYGVTASLDFPPYVYVENDRFTVPASETFPGRPFPAYLRKGEIAPGFKHVEALDHLADKAVAYIDERAKGGAPFFLYLPLTSPHKPTLPAPRFRGKTGLGPYGDFVLQTDSVVGRVLFALKKHQIDRNTLVVMTSDNGSYMHRLDKGPGHAEKGDVQGFLPSSHRPNHIWRGTKADVWEGGHRVPFLVRWPARVKAGTRCNETICLTDFLGTCAEIVGVSVPEEAGEDSFSLLPLLDGGTWAEPRAPVIHHSINGTFALRKGQWKMIFGLGSGGRGTPKSKPWSKPYQLYDMKADPSETTNLLEKQPEVVEQLTAELERIRSGG